MSDYDDYNDEDLDEFDMYDDSDDDEDDESGYRDEDDFEERLRELESRGYDDGYYDASSSADFYQGYGLSIDEDDLTEEEKSAYKTGYYDGFEVGKGQ